MSKMIKKKEENPAAYLFHEGTNYRAYDYLGCHRDGEMNIFRVWAPHADKVYVAGSFNNWEPRQYEAYKITEEGPVSYTHLDVYKRQIFYNSSIP